MIPVVFLPDLDREFLCGNSSCIDILDLERKIFTTGKVTDGIDQGDQKFAGSGQVHERCDKHIPGYSGDFRVNHQDFHAICFLCYHGLVQAGIDLFCEPCNVKRPVTGTWYCLGKVCSRFLPVLMRILHLLQAGSRLLQVRLH